MIINALPSTTTGLSPYYVEIGREFRLPFLKGLIKRVDFENTSFQNMDVASYTARRAEQLHSLIKLVAERLRLTTLKTMRKYVRKHGSNQVYRFKPGDHVGLRRPRPGKLSDVAEFGFEFVKYIDEHLHTAQIKRGCIVRECNTMDLILLPGQASEFEKAKKGK